MSNGKSRFAQAFEAQEAAAQLAAKQQGQRREERSCNERGADRLEHAEPAYLYTATGLIAANVQNLSVGGAMVMLSEGDVLRANDTVSLRLLDGRHILARVARVEGRNLGLEFDDKLDSLDEITHFESREPWLYPALAYRPTER